jgi:hypothetical protein
VHHHSTLTLLNLANQRLELTQSCVKGTVEPADRCFSPLIVEWKELKAKELVMASIQFKSLDFAALTE